MRAMAQAGTPSQPERSRRPEQTVSVLTYRTGVQDANIAGHVHGGQIMKLCDDAAAIAATRLAGVRVVTAAVDGMRFRSPVHVGDVITLRSTVNAVWRTSMEVGVRVEAERPAVGTVRHTNSAYLTMVAVDDEGRPREVPPLVVESADEERRERAAQTRRRNRLAERDEIV